jgi:hypothetical protein
MGGGFRFTVKLPETSSIVRLATLAAHGCQTTAPTAEQEWTVNDMLLITKKKKRRIAAHLGFLWFYIRRIVEPEEFMDAAEVFTDLCIDFEIDWKWVMLAADRYGEVVRNYGVVKRGIGNG